MDTYQSVREEFADSWLERASEDQAQKACDAISRIDPKTVTPAMFAKLAQALDGKAIYLTGQCKEVARDYLADLFTDMEGFANEH